MHSKRVLTAITILPILLFITIKCHPAFLLAIIVAFNLIAYFEYAQIACDLTYTKEKKIIFYIGLIISPFIIFFNYLNLFHLTSYLLLSDFVLIVIVSFRKPLNFKVYRKQFFGLVYISFSLSCALLIRNNVPDGIAWLIFTLFLVMASDTGAYYIGSKFGKHKLTSISPNKTVEGLFGGLVTLFIVGFIFRLFLFPYLTLNMSLIFFLLVSFIAPLGDIFESYIKRSVNIKDSGTILPGHGGVLDRIDSLLFVLPFSYLFRIYLI